MGARTFNDVMLSEHSYRRICTRIGRCTVQLVIAQYNNIVVGRISRVRALVDNNEQ